MTQCYCAPNPFVINCTPPPISYDCNDRIRMFFGHRIDTTNNNIGQLNKIYYTNSVDINSIKNGFSIDNYSFQDLVDSGVLPDSVTYNNEFKLTEAELLSTANFESWMIWIATSVSTFTDPLDPALSDGQFCSFGYACMKLLGYDFEKMKQRALRLFQALTNGDSSGQLASLNSCFVPLPNFWDSSLDPYPEVIGLTDECRKLKSGQAIESLYICYEWIKNIYDTYYGKEFLVNIAPPSGNGVGICIKDQNGDYPENSIEPGLSLVKPYYIDSDGLSQGYSVSDEISSDGGFPHEGSSNILGIGNLDWIINENGKIQSFARVGNFSSSSITPNPTQNIDCAADQIVYTKFYNPYSGVLTGSSGCYQWLIDLSKLQPDRYYIENIQADPESPTIDQVLYVPCDIEPRYYIDDNGTWVKFTLQEKIPLRPNLIDLSMGFSRFQILMILATINDLGLTDTTTGTLISEAYSKFEKFKEKTTEMGSVGNASQLNITQMSEVSLIPEGVAIPFKSNTSKYGPYYFPGYSNDPGLVDIVIEENIAPWYFLKQRDTNIADHISSSYAKMDEYGKALAAASPKNLQKLEKAKITVAGLPCYCLGHSVDVDTANCLTYASGPTLLTDMSVEYGSGGFNTTYNFSTYSPRLGRPEKYIRDMWSDNIRKLQVRNKYLKEQKDKLFKTNQTYQSRLITGAKKGGGTDILYGKGRFIKLRDDSTPNRLLFSGYYLGQAPLYSDPINGYSAYPSVSPPETDQPSCEESVCNPSEYNPPIPNVSGQSYRLYSFAESDKAYSYEYIQNTYYQLSGMSLDGLYLPVSLRGVDDDPNKTEYQRVSATDRNYLLNGNKLVRDTTWKNSGKLPRFAMRCENSGAFIEWDHLRSSGEPLLDSSFVDDPGYPISSKTRDEMPPFRMIGGSSNVQVYNLQINQKYLNPILSTKNLLGAEMPYDKIDGWDDRKNDTDKGFVISSIVFGQDHDEYQITHINENDYLVEEGKLELENTDEFIRQQYNNFRLPAMRGPLVLQSWGYDTSGKPIPNWTDDRNHAELGQFRKDKLTDKFMENWIQNPKTWPVGPIDLRFDRERGVWTCASPNKIVVARLKEDLEPGSSAKAELINPEADGVKFYEHYTLCGPNGDDIRLSLQNAEITVYDYLGIKLCVCDVIYAYYDDNRYIVLESNRAYKDPSEICEDICTTATESASLTTSTTTQTTATTSPTPTTTTPSASVTTPTPTVTAETSTTPPTPTTTTPSGSVTTPTPTTATPTGSVTTPTPTTATPTGTAKTSTPIVSTVDVETTTTTTTTTAPTSPTPTGTASLPTETIPSTAYTTLPTEPTQPTQFTKTPETITPSLSTPSEPTSSPSIPPSTPPVTSPPTPPTTPGTPDCWPAPLAAMKQIPGYVAGKIQILAHDEEGCPMWIDTNSCENPLSTEPSESQSQGHGYTAYDTLDDNLFSMMLEPPKQV